MVKIAEVTRYQTVDGQEFALRESAARHGAELALLAVAEKVLAHTRHNSPGTPGERLVMAMVANITALREALDQVAAIFEPETLDSAKESGL